MNAVEEEEEIARRDEHRAVRDMEDAQGREDQREADGDQCVIAGDAEPDRQHLQALVIVGPAAASRTRR